MRIFVTGANSYVGARIYSELKEKFDVLGSYHNKQLFPELRQLDITDRKSVEKLISGYHPAIIVHVAALPNPAACEKNPAFAREVNERGTKNTVDAANDVGAKVIYLSSFAAISPVNVYGETKLAGEGIVKGAQAGYAIFRPSLIIGSSPNTENDRPHNRLLWNIVNKTPPVYDISWKFQPTWLGHLSECISLVIEREIYGETIPVAVPELKSRYEVARDILKHFGIRAIQEDKKDSSPSEFIKLDKLKELNLPRYSYGDIISKVVDELKMQIKN